MESKCWRSIGVWGDLSCSQLATEIHCRNCSVYSQGGRALLERLEPEGYTAEWTALMALPRMQPEKGPGGNHQQSSAVRDRLSLTIFRLQQEWMALPASVFDQVVSPSPVHSMPHYHNPLLRGIVNVHGQILPCVSIHALLGITASVSTEPVGTLALSSTQHFTMTDLLSPDVSSPNISSSNASSSNASSPNISSPNISSSNVLSPRLAPPRFSPKGQAGDQQQGGYPRLVVIKQQRESWAFEVDELYGLQACQESDLRQAPALTHQALASFTKATFAWKDQNVSYLEAQQLFSVLRQRAL
ncbi:MAG: chemotaxis protein CheW [Cyanobacteria bacterium J06597_16]